MKRSSLLVPAIILIFALTATARPRTSNVTIPGGTQLQVRIIENLSSENAKVGEAFHGTLEEPVVVNGETIFPRGSDVTGKITEAHASGRLSDPGVLTLVVTSITSGGRTARLESEPFRIKGESHTKSNVTKIGGGAAAGAIIGAIVGGGKGAAIGAGVGAAAGTGVAAATGRKDSKVESEAVLGFTTAGPVATDAANAAPNAARSQSAVRDFSDEETSAAKSFSEDDRQTIRDCFAANQDNLPPGLAKRDRLPPGLERQLQRNGTLPPGLQKRVQEMPDVCERQLPGLPEGLWRGVYSRRVMLLDQNYRILDIFNVDE